MKYNIEILNKNSVRKTDHVYSSEFVDYLEKLINHLQRHPDPMIVSAGNFKRLPPTGKSYFEYSYDMHKLKDLPNGEVELIDTVGDYYSRFGKKCLLHLTEETKNKFRERPKLLYFLHRLIQQGRYQDLHGGNIMLDKQGNYRLIDLEGFFNSPLDYSWLS